MTRKGFLLAALLCAALCVSGCKKEVSEKVEELNISATFYPVYAITAMIAKGVPDLHLSCIVQPQDGCLRDYALSDWDLSLMLGSDAVILGGRGLEGFESTLSALGEEGPATAAIFCNAELLPAACADIDGESHWADANPFVYMTIDGATEAAKSAEAALAAFDPRYEAEYLKNLKAAENDLEALRTEIHEITGDLSGKQVCAMNEALLYTAQEYGLETVSVCRRESGEELSEAALRDFTESAEAKVVLIEKQAPETLVKALEASEFTVVRLDTMFTRRAGEGAEGYFAAQRENALALKEAFSEETTP